MSDRYVHHFPFAGSWDERQANLLRLGQHLVRQARAIRAAGGLAFGHEDMAGLRPSPQEVRDAVGVRLPPLAHGPLAGIAAQPGEDWPGYVERVFGVSAHRPFMAWLQSPMWAKTEPSPEGAALRIAYALDYGVPHDHVEIAMGQAHTDYDSNGFLWEKLGLLPDEVDDEAGDPRPTRQWPAWIGAVEQARQRAAVRADFLIPPGEAPFSLGFGVDRLAALKARRGPVADVFSDFLRLSGRRDDGQGVYGDRLEAIDAAARQRIFAEGRVEDDPVPEDALFIGLEDGRHPEFILGGARVDSPVFRFDADSGRVTRLGISIFVWVEAFMARVAEAEKAAAPVPPAGGEDGWLRGMIRRWFG